MADEETLTAISTNISSESLPATESAMFLREGTIVDATLIAAPPLTKNN